MKKIILLPALIILLGSASLKASVKTNYIAAKYITDDSLAVYTGKYKMEQNGQMYNVMVSIADGHLLATPSWNSNKLQFNHLTGDNFIVSGLEWSVKFVRDKDNSILEMIVSGRDHWEKIKQ